MDTFSHHHIQGSNISGQDFNATKKRRVLRACDMCRKRKIKCTGADGPNDRCANCTIYKWSCTFGEPSKHDHPTKSYVEDLERRLQASEELLKHFCPDADTRNELEHRLAKGKGPSRTDDSFSSSSPDVDGTATHPHIDHAIHQHSVRIPNIPAPNEQQQLNETERVDQEDPESEDDATHVVASTFASLNLNAPDAERQDTRFFGRSSGAMLARTAMEMKAEYLKATSASVPGGNLHSAHAQSQSHAQTQGSTSTSTATSAHFISPQETKSNAPGMTMKNIRPDFWLPRPWEVARRSATHSNTSNASASSSSSPFSSASPPYEAIHSPSPFATSPSPPAAGAPAHSASSIYSFAESSSSSGARPHLRANHDLELPPSDLARSLIDLYFLHTNLYFPLFHRPTFDRLVHENGFLSDGEHASTADSKDGQSGGRFQFVHVFLLVCAVGAYFSDDPRCLLHQGDLHHDGRREHRDGFQDEGDHSHSDSSGGGNFGEGLPYSAGWKWFDQVQMSSRSFIAPPTLYDLQVFALCAQFLQATSAPQSAWTVCGIGIRLAQDIGAHRRGHGTMGPAPSAVGELWKRAFWVLVVMDRLFSCYLGRSCAIQDEDFDLEPPIDCDDEFWNTDKPDASKRFHQPSGKPSLMTQFLLLIELTHILTFSLRTIYSINKSRALSGLIGPNWQQSIVLELDSALNKWASSIPDHLKWDPHREDLRFFNQSAALSATHHHIQILVHRPFIPSPKAATRPSAKTVPSLAICANAARACCHVIDVQQRRTGAVIAHAQPAVWQSGLILLLSIWGGKSSGLLIDPRPQMEDVQKCINILQESEKRWFALGRLCDILRDLASFSTTTGPLSPIPTRQKRDRDDTHETEVAPTAWGVAPSPIPAAPRSHPTVEFDDIYSNAATQNAIFDSSANASLLPAAVAFPDIDYTRYSMSFGPLGFNPYDWQQPIQQYENLGMSNQGTTEFMDAWLKTAADIEFAQLSSYLTDFTPSMSNVFDGLQTSSAAPAIDESQRLPPWP